MAQRRANGEGSIRQRADGRWAGEIRVGQKRRTVYGKTRKEVVDQLAVIRHDALLGRTVEPTTMTVAEYLDHWIEHATHLRPSTAHLYRLTITAHIVPVIGDFKLKNLSPLHLQEVYRRIRAKGGRVRATERTHRLLNKTLGDAVKMRLLPNNPASMIDVEKAKPQERILWTLGQIQALSLSCSRYEHPYDALWMFLLATGCRSGEALALREDHVDWEGSEVSIGRAIGHIGNEPYEDEPKTAAGTRTISVPPFGMDALRSQRGRFEGGYLFRNSRGNIPSASDLRRGFQAACWRAGIPSGTPHDLRRMHATLAIANGVDVKNVQRRLGHASLAMTLGIYAKAMSGGDVMAAKILESVVVPRTDTAGDSTTHATPTPDDQPPQRRHDDRSPRTLGTLRRRHRPALAE